MGDMQADRKPAGKILCDDFYGGILKPVTNGVYSVDPARRICFWNKAAERLTGYPSAAVLGHSCSDNILRHVTESGKCLCEEGCPLAATLRDGHPREAYVFLHHRDGYRVPVHVSVAAHRNSSGMIDGAVETFSGNTIYMHSLEELKQNEKQHFIDPLTGLANRRFMHNAFESRIAETRRLDKNFGVILARLDDFASFGQKYGATIGERMLKAVSQTFLLNCTGMEVIGRWEDEKFLVIDPNVSADELGATAKRLCALIGNSWLDAEDRTQLHTTASFGVAMSQRDDTMETMLARAEKHLAESQCAGGNCVMM